MVIRHSMQGPCLHQAMGARWPGPWLRQKHFPGDELVTDRNYFGIACAQGKGRLLRPFPLERSSSLFEALRQTKVVTHTEQSVSGHIRLRIEPQVNIRRRFIGQVCDTQRKRGTSLWKLVICHDVMVELGIDRVLVTDAKGIE